MLMLEIKGTSKSNKRIIALANLIPYFGNKESTLALRYFFHDTTLFLRLILVRQILISYSRTLGPSLAHLLRYSMILYF
jgi:hypothetical protein